MPDIWDSTSAFLQANIGTRSSIRAFLASGFGRSNQQAFVQGIRGAQSSGFPAYTYGGVVVTDSQPAFIPAGIGTSSSVSAYTAFSGGTLRSSIFAYMGEAPIRSSLHVGGMVGASMAVDYIELQTSDGGATLTKRFKVLTQGYDDGTLDKAENLQRTIGGGIDHSVGEVYRSWNMIIRVRHTETDANYGTLADLRTFYNLNDPGGTPSNDITLIDHHQQSYTVHFVGSLESSVLGSMIEGEYAIFIVKVRMIEV